MDILTIGTGPADPVESCQLMFLHAATIAKERLWIASPYFVPDIDLVNALQLAALRGVDVRILLPRKVDHFLVYMASFTFLEPLDMPNIQFLRYDHGFMHQKVILVDDDLALVGTANADNRSFRLNFEITMAVADAGFAKQVKAMLEEDFTHAQPDSAEVFLAKPWYFRVAARLSRLFAPIL